MVKQTVRQSRGRSLAGARWCRTNAGRLYLSERSRALRRRPRFVREASPARGGRVSRRSRRTPDGRCARAATGGVRAVGREAEASTRRGGGDGELHPPRTRPGLGGRIILWRITGRRRPETAGHPRLTAGAARPSSSPSRSTPSGLLVREGRAPRAGRPDGAPGGSAMCRNVRTQPRSASSPAGPKRSSRLLRSCRPGGDGRVHPARRFGAEHEAYRRAVPGWWPVSQFVARARAGWLE